jgi:hypothetical protein
MHGGTTIKKKDDDDDDNNTNNNNMTIQYNIQYYCKIAEPTITLQCSTDTRRVKCDKFHIRTDRHRTGITNPYATLFNEPVIGKSVLRY